MRYLLLLIFLLSSMSLNAAYYRSNIVGQQLEEVQSAPTSGWYLEVFEGKETLYKDGMVESERSWNEESESITTKNGTRTLTFKDGRRDSETFEDGTFIRYTYTDDGILKRAIVSRDGEAEVVIDYNYSKSSGLSSVKHTDLSRSFFSKGSLSYVDNGESVHVTILPNNHFVREVYNGEGNVEDILSEARVAENGDVVVKEKLGAFDLITTYSPTGLILREETYDGETMVSHVEYNYDDKEVLLSSVKVEGESETRKYYNEKGRVDLEERYVSGLIDVTRKHQSDGRILETIYKGGYAYSEILLDKDGLRVLDLKMLR